MSFTAYKQLQVLEHTKHYHKQACEMTSNIIYTNYINIQLVMSCPRKKTVSGGWENNVRIVVTQLSSIHDLTQPSDDPLPVLRVSTSAGKGA